MAPKRKSQPTSDSEADLSSSSSVPAKKAPAAKKPKAPKEPVKPLHADLPINTVFPTELVYEKKEDGTVRLACWNVCGINACEKKGFSTYLAAEDADIVVITETKGANPVIAEIVARYPHVYWGNDAKKGYAGTAILSKMEPLNVTYGMDTTTAPQAESAGRLITLEFENTFVVGTYVPNAGANLVSMDRKEEWNRAFEVYLRQLSAKKAVIWTGDINCLGSSKDIRNWKTNHNKSAGCTDIEMKAYDAQLNPSAESGHSKLVDVWRHLNPDLEGHYTYFSYRFQCRVKGIGYRLDSFLLTEALLPRVKSCAIRMTAYGASDHVPVMLDISGPL